MKTRLLDDSAVQRYIVDGHLAICPTLPADYHPALKAQLDALIERDGNPGNDLIERIPDLARLFADPAVAGALQSLLGPDYLVHPHRHCHHNTQGSGGQNMHQDSYEDDQNVRHHRTRWGMAFYYPQDTPVELGPTGIIPGSHYHNGDPADDLPGEVPLTGEAGTVVLVHYDLWHRAMPNSTERPRYMVKFLFTRLQEPNGPSWDTAGADWPAEDDPRMQKEAE